MSMLQACYSFEWYSLPMGGGCNGGRTEIQCQEGLWRPTVVLSPPTSTCLHLAGFMQNLDQVHQVLGWFGGGGRKGQLPPFAISGPTNMCWLQIWVQISCMLSVCCPLYIVWQQQTNLHWTLYIIACGCVLFLIDVDSFVAQSFVLCLTAVNICRSDCTLCLQFTR